MAISKITFISGYVLFALYFFSVGAEEKGKCGDVNLEVTEEDMMSLSECIKEAGAESWKDLGENKLACFGKCVIVKKGLVDDEGIPHKENILEAVNASVPELIRDDLVVRIDTCLTEQGAKVDPKDGTCNTYTPLIECIHLSFIEVCKAE